MSFRSDSLFKRLTPEQRESLMLFIHSEKDGDVYVKAAKLVLGWGVKCSRTAVWDLYSRYSYGWCVERAAAVSAASGSQEMFEKELNSLTIRKLLVEVEGAKSNPKLLVAVRALKLEQDKIFQKAEDIKLRRDRFEFDAAKAALKHLDALRSIRNDKSLTDDTRLRRVREKLFGVLPPE